MSEHDIPPVVGEENVSVAASGMLPSGTVTFLFTDIEGSTRLWESASPAMAAALERHDSIVRAAVERHGGRVFATGGDGFAAAFSRASDAVAAAVEAQAELASCPWPQGVAIRVRMAVHTGEVVERGGDYFGPTVNRTARLMAIAHGGQVLCSAATAALLDETMSVVDLGQHRLRDLSAAQRVFQVGDGVFAPLRSPDVVPTNLPVALTELVGRDTEVHDIAKVLAGDRLVTLTGPGGVGKTRLALTAAAEAAASFPDGCWLVELARVTGGDGVVHAVASAVGASSTDPRLLPRYLADRRVLLVLDNCEHLVEDVARLVEDILVAGADPVILATSREPLGVAGEHVRRVGSLSLPGVDVDAVADAVESEAVRLFVARAAAAGRFELRDGNVGAVVEVCRRLDGIPLAIELAAVQTAAMPVEEVAKRLDERFRLLAGGSRRAQERHRTLQATVGWSYDLLSEPERAVFRRLSVFPASFDLAAAEAVAGSDGVEVVPALVLLVQRSMVTFDETTGRYSLLETLRQYGADRLHEAGETHASREGHTAHFRALAAELVPQLHTAAVIAAERCLAVEEENLRAAAAWLGEQHRWDELFELCDSLWEFWFQQQTHHWCAPLAEAIAHSTAVDARTRGEALGKVAYASYLIGDLASALAYADDAEAVAAEASLPPPIHSAWTRAYVASARGDSNDALRHVRVGFDAAKQTGDDVMAAMFLSFVAAELYEVGEPDEGRRVGDEALEQARAAGDVGWLRNATFAVSAARVWSGRTDDAETAITLLAELDRTGLPPRLDCVAHLLWGGALVLTQREGASQHLARAIELADRHHLVNITDTAAQLLAIAVGRRGDITPAARLIGYARANQTHGWLADLHQRWITPEIEAILQSLPDHERATHLAAGAAMTRRQFLALVAKLADN